MANRSGVAGLALAAVLAGCAVPTAGGGAASEEAPFRLEQVTAGLERPWGLAFLPDGRMLVTERPGRLRLIGGDGALASEPLWGLPDDLVATGQGGLLDIALDPDFERERWVYLSYAAGRRDGTSTLKVVRGRLEGMGLADVEELFVAEPWVRSGRHFGSRLAFGSDAMLYVTIGDRGTMEKAQDVRDHAGSTLRLHPDGRIPDDNPFRDRAEARPELFTIGNRNAQGMAVHPATGALWQHEHGPRGGDEINRIVAGANYGWPIVTHGTGYNFLPIGVGTEAPGMMPPVHHWTPSIAPSGMAFYRGDAFPDWQGDLLVGALAHRKLVRVMLEGDRVVGEEALLEGDIGRIRDVRVGPDGLVYLLNDEAPGALFRLRPAG